MGKPKPGHPDSVHGECVNRPKTTRGILIPIPSSSVAGCQPSRVRMFRSCYNRAMALITATAETISRDVGRKGFTLVMVDMPNGSGLQSLKPLRSAFRGLARKGTVDSCVYVDIADCAFVPELKINVIPMFHIYRNGFYWGHSGTRTNSKRLRAWVGWLVTCPENLGSLSPLAIGEKYLANIVKR